MCSDVPADHIYYMTSFCDKSVACGSFSGNCNEWYMAGYKRFGCGSIVSCCQGTNCVNLKVIDGGPGCSVEDMAKKQIVDCSFSACKHFTGSTSCGWSDRVKVTCKKTSKTLADTYEVVEGSPFSLQSAIGKVPLGPCSYNQAYAASKNVPICGPDAHLFAEHENNFTE